MTKGRRNIAGRNESGNGNPLHECIAQDIRNLQVKWCDEIKAFISHLSNYEMNYILRKVTQTEIWNA